MIGWSEKDLDRRGGVDLAHAYLKMRGDCGVGHGDKICDAYRTVADVLLECPTPPGEGPVCRHEFRGFRHEILRARVTRHEWFCCGR